ncbi:thiamine-phosphate kinase [Candidatus Bathyarchaeota archaeon]|nr:thiamine-phosphate kinase [Candidatus Bathyarchaeota archaeon]
MAVKTAKDLGERRIIELIQNRLDKSKEMVVPFGDDVAATSLQRGLAAVLKTDTLVGKFDIPPGMTYFQAARKAVVMNISDFSAKGVQPKVLLISIGFPPNFTEVAVNDIANGLNSGCREYSAYLIGGDTSQTSDLIITCMVFGTAKTKNIVPRGGSIPGDVLAVTGSFGKTASGLKLLLKDLKTPAALRKRLLESVYMPKARLREGLALAGERVITASIDSSDGLAISLHEMRKMSRKGFEVTKLPIDKDAYDFAKLHNLDVRELALYGGEEYELVVTIKRKNWEKAVRAAESSGGSLTEIGVVTADPRIVLKENDKIVEIPYRGWEHFKSEQAEL